MTTAKPQKPLTTRGKVFGWFLIVLMALVGLLGGGAVMAEGFAGRGALADGPVGSLTPTERGCGKSDCWWIGDFVSEDASITRTGVELHQSDDVRRTTPMPARIDNVRLHDDAERPAAYSTDYSSMPRIAGGTALLVGGVAGAAVLARVLLKRRPR
ncbi:hypothetical protein [Prauserella cavernicola]|uniref:Uncharacterized protein n=1 Tax=Prauserella cavernicola TaxID=2800127 RepID=A0A934QVU9_9PSEU|nr:hypothetical protein [Prauserella cavernicola]MBK1787500.1 hypothetical protein [Prauserella cavernicola]